jgi:hypothetical protein
MTVAVLDTLWAVVSLRIRYKREQRSTICGKNDILDGKKRKNCVVRAITTIDHNWFVGFLRVSTVFCVGI